MENPFDNNEKEDGKTSVLPMPSLNVLTFNAAFDKYIVTQEDALLAAVYILSKSNIETIDKIREIALTKRYKLKDLKWKNSILASIDLSPDIADLVQKSTFEEEDDTLFVKVDTYTIEFVEKDVDIRHKIFPYYSWSLYGTADSYTLSVSHEETKLDLLRYVLVIWKFFEIYDAERTENFIDGVNYRGLKDVFDSDEESDDIPELIDFELPTLPIPNN